MQKIIDTTALTHQQRIMIITRLQQLGFDLVQITEPIIANGTGTLWSRMGFPTGTIVTEAA